MRPADGRYAPFGLYTMRQAIEENFILDVLANYTTYKTYWSLLKTVAEDPRYDRVKAAYLLKSFVDLHQQALAKKVTIMLEHFISQVQHRINGKAKAMIVTRSRQQAVRYKLEVDRYLRDHNCPFQALVALSVTDHDAGFDVNEFGINGMSAEP